MVNYVLPKFITKKTRDKKGLKFSAVVYRIDRPEPRIITCYRCIQNIAREGPKCNRDQHLRCRKCTKGNRGRCYKIAPEWYGRYERLYELWDLYKAAVAAAPTDPIQKRRDPAVQRTGATLARAQRVVTSELSAWRRDKARAGEPIGLATKRPESTEEFLALMLVEQKAQTKALNSLAESARRVARTFDDNDDDSAGDDSDGGSDGDAGEEEPEGPPASSQNLRRPPPSSRTRPAGNGGDGGGGGDGVPTPTQDAGNTGGDSGTRRNSARKTRAAGAKKSSSRSAARVDPADDEDEDEEDGDGDEDNEEDDVGSEMEEV